MLLVLYCHSDTSCIRKRGLCAPDRPSPEWVIIKSSSRYSADFTQESLLVNTAQEQRGQQERRAKMIDLQFAFLSQRARSFSLQKPDLQWINAPYRKHTWGSMQISGGFYTKVPPQLFTRSSRTKTPQIEAHIPELYCRIKSSIYWSRSILIKAATSVFKHNV